MQTNRHTGQCAATRDAATVGTELGGTHNKTKQLKQWSVSMKNHQMEKLACLQ